MGPKAHPEMQENGRLMMPVYLHQPAPWWREPGWEDLPEGLRKMFHLRLEEVIDLHPEATRVRDIELCGSRAFGCASLMSDVDINVVYVPPSPGTGMNGRCVVEETWSYVYALHLMEHEFGIHIDVCWSSESMADHGVPSYSFYGDEFHWKRYGESLSVHYKKENGMWVPCPPKDHAIMVGEDPWRP